MHKNAPLICGAIGFVFFLIGMGKFVSDRLFDRYGVRVVGTVTGSGRITATSSVRYVRFSFTAPDGREYSGRSSGYGGDRGQTILVEYLDFYPGWNRVAGAGQSSRKWFLPIAGFGGLFTFAGFQWFFALKRRRRLKEWLLAMGHRASGKVERVDLGNGVLHYSFPLPDGRSVKGRTLGGEPKNVRVLEIGGTIEILYDPADPSRNVWTQE